MGHNMWQKVITLAFKGERFRDHALDLGALAELSQFQKMVAETAKELWRSANPDRKNLPAHFENRTRLCLRTIEDGSAVAPLEVFLEEALEPQLFEEGPKELKEAVCLAYRVFNAAERDEALPEDFPKSLIPEYEKWGQTLGEDEAIEVRTNGSAPVLLTQASRSRLSAFVDRGQVGRLEVRGEVLEADIRQNRFQLWQDEKTCVTVSFSPEQEEQVTNALRDHKMLRLRAEGVGEFSALGKPLKITQANLVLEPVKEARFDSKALSIEDVLANLAKEVPSEDWNKLPPDLANNLDHYLYGSPKK